MMMIQCIYDDLEYIEVTKSDNNQSYKNTNLKELLIWKMQTFGTSTLCVGSNLAVVFSVGPNWFMCVVTINHSGSAFLLL